MKVTIDMYSDYACPFCYLGKENLKAAINALHLQDDVDIRYHSFQLDPNIDQSHPIDLEHFAKMKGISLQQLLESQKELGERLQEKGLTMHYDKLIVANSFDAHRLVKFATTQNKATELQDRLLKASLEQGLDIADYNVLTTLAVEIGLDKDAVKAVLNSGDYAYSVIQDLDSAREQNISGVPFFVINNRYPIYGAQPEYRFEDTLRRALLEMDDAPIKKEKKPEVCEGDCCLFE
ncbi:MULTISPECIES: DsbA family oxidoreductase [unclassified Breznakia]|uniref:DsbA family oxidoreductase n=1 Tax=unclassified Breznakia TaxID=2623764 RepID=UPI002473F364|nr:MULTISPECIES: DsbA family oxidoreductase [unclassified Breznakia]MDH6368153.1 putative DsbA family dithiol-disulfide isomerase [Breznakia sp. PH1-1]MDH6405242.1 putative DsbA family dithiol-disulfide isomerase [Breznakia sp. PF1-11]MDH6412952.1 putative DsbA family dithiol-disulfide isomerase [Breznakia sp. PFB1-11]MDH6415314.1 putative DsbA family dithiol-disulfide isomerase [Breznakia sp. PFB1-14]MDH6416963.1 putative DsbA family dithiol-disulfide isomerase [Breznakia sp. PFB1-4]